LIGPKSVVVQFEIWDSEARSYRARDLLFAREQQVPHWAFSPVRNDKMNFAQTAPLL